jgi:aspartyl-tRNA(Asn)/glutamyl-tRNA(Gln) amidotransferase subunit A
VTFDRAVVAHVAELARLQLDAEGEARLVEELGRIVEYVGRVATWAEGEGEESEVEEAGSPPLRPGARQAQCSSWPHAAAKEAPPSRKGEPPSDFPPLADLSTSASSELDRSLTWHAVPGPASWSARRIAEAVRKREVSAVEVVEAHLARIEAVEPRIGAWIEVFGDDARRRAEQIDRRVAAGEDPGPLAGVPVAVKDNLSMAGEAMSCASRILDGYVSPYTATAVERLVAAGAVPLGRANLDEMAMGSSTETSAFHPTRNPWHPQRVPGGSSGGPAAAVAAGMAAVALGSDTGGSVRQPAAFCGLVGVKPTWGRVSRFGLAAFASSLDTVGPLARDVLDAARALAVLAGSDPRDATCSRRPVPDYEAAALRGAESVAGRRVGVVRELAAAPLSDDGRRAWEATLARLARLGCDLVEVSVPAVEAAIAAYHLVGAAEASANLARYDGVRYGRRAAGAGSYDAMVAASRGAGFGAEVQRRVLLGTFALSAGYRDAYYGRARAVMARLRRELRTALGAADLLVTPTAFGGAFPLGEYLRDPLAFYLADAFTVPVSLAGLPAVAVPAGRDRDGLPLSLQVVGPPFGEAEALALALAWERDASG